MKYLCFRELDDFLLLGGSIRVDFGPGEEIRECTLVGRNDLVPISLFSIYFKNGLIGRVGAKEFALTMLGRQRMKRRLPSSEAT